MLEVVPLLAGVRPLGPSLLPSAAKLLAEGFFDNPAHVYICPDPLTRAAQLEWLLGANLRLQPDLEMSFCLSEGDRVDAMGFWTRSTAPKPGLLRQLRAGLLAAPFRIGWSTFQRAFEVARANERHVHRALGAQPFWYLNNMVIRKQLRGGGVGSRLLREQLGVVSAREPGWAIALSTQRPENVVFYHRLGFRTVLEESIGSGPRAFRNWIMVFQEARA